ncbi:MAG: flavodoxin family protein, partial [Methanospirillum sp.]|nr:flavodoxin family protein [Methanospirillum sp.]
MQVIGINSSPRKKSNTDLLLINLLRGVSAGGGETVHIDLYDYDIGFCKACETCYKTGSCAITDDFEEIYDIVLESDGIVLSSPNYINNVTAVMKTFLDRMADTVHCQRLLGKYAAAVSTAGGSGAGEVAGYLNQSMFIMGADIVGKVGVNLADGEEMFNKGVSAAYELGVEFADAIITKTVYPDQKENHEAMLKRMTELVSFRRDDWPHEYEY